MFSQSAKIKEAVGFINNLDGSRFPILLSRILGKLHLKEPAFSEYEKEKLHTALSLTSAQTELLIHTTEFILQQAAYHNAKPAALNQQLKSLDMNEDKVDMIVEAWTTQARGVIDKLKQHSLAPCHLEDVSWRLHLEMANDSQSRLKQPAAFFQLGINNQDTQSTERVNIEFSHDELYQFYNKLETIQSQIDSLS